MNQRITRIQRALEQPFESASRELGMPWISNAAFAAQIAREIVGGTRLAPSGKAYPPDQFTVTLNPEKASSVKVISETLQERISEILQDVLKSFTYEVITKPHVTLATDPTLGVNDLRIIGWHSSNPLAVSERMTEIEEHDTQRPPKGAFLVIDGRQHYELKQPVIRIGRRLDNDLVLDDPHVSREHIRLIARNHRYLLEDLDSTAGTRVNGKQVREHFLRPGDVINVASIDLIYGEDTGGPPDVTPPYQPGEGPEERDRVTPLDMRVNQVTRELRHAKDEEG